MKLTWDNILIIILMLFVIIFPFWKGTEGNYGQIWEDVSIVATLFYAFLIYAAGFIFKQFEGLKDWHKGLIGFIVLFLIPVISISYIVGFLRIFYPEMDEIYNEYLNLYRYGKMIILLIVSLLFTLVDYIMLKNANDGKINYATNFYVSDIPVSIIFAILLVHSIYVGDEAIKTNALNHFYEGAIAFQMIFSNIIWMYNDDKFWSTILTNKKDKNMPLCGFNEKMLKGLSAFNEGLVEHGLKYRSELNDETIEQAIKREISDMTRLLSEIHRIDDNAKRILTEGIAKYAMGFYLLMRKNNIEDYKEVVSKIGEFFFHMDNIYYSELEGKPDDMKELAESLDKKEI